MPTTDHGAPYPSPLDARNVPAHVQALAQWADEHAVYYANGSADRDSRFSDAPSGTIVSSGDTGEVWQKTATAKNTWRTILSDTGWVEAGFVVADDFEVGAYLKICRMNGWVELRAELNYTGADPIKSGDTTVSKPGNMPDTNVLTVPPQFAPGGGVTAGYVVAPWRSLYTGGTATLYSTGRLTIVDGHTASTIENGEFVRFSAFYRQG